MADLWEHFLESDDERIELECESLEQADDIKKALSVYKTRSLKDTAIKNLLGDLRLKFEIRNSGKHYTKDKITTKGVLLIVTRDEEERIKHYPVKIRGVS